MSFFCLQNVFGYSAAQKHTHPTIQYQPCNTQDEAVFSKELLLSTAEAFANSILKNRTEISTSWSTDRTYKLSVPPPKKTGVIIETLDGDVTKFSLCQNDEKADFFIQEKLSIKEEHVMLDFNQSYVDLMPHDRTSYYCVVCKVERYTCIIKKINPDPVEIKIIATILKQLDKDLKSLTNKR